MRGMRGREHAAERCAPESVLNVRKAVVQALMQGAQVNVSRVVQRAGRDPSDGVHGVHDVKQRDGAGVSRENKATVRAAE